MYRGLDTSKTNVMELENVNLQVPKTSTRAV